MSRPRWGPALPGQLPPPTPRAMEVLRETFRRGTVKEAAQALAISHVTAKNHLSQVYRRIGVDTMAEAAYVLWLRDLWGEGRRRLTPRCRLPRRPGAPGRARGHRRRTNSAPPGADRCG